MEYYGLRPAGADIDFVVTSADHAALADRYPDHLKDLAGDLGVCVDASGTTFELWTSICLFDYAALTPGAIEQPHYLVISLEKLLLLKALGIEEAKYERDVRLIVRRILEMQYGKA